MLEGEDAQCPVPCRASEKTRGSQRCIAVRGVPGSLPEIQERAHGVACDLGGDTRVPAQVRTVIARYASALLLNSGVQKPCARAGDVGIGQRSTHCNIAVLLPLAKLPRHDPLSE